MLKTKRLSLSVVLMLAVVAASGCASKPAPQCAPVKMPAWVLELSKQPSLIRHLDQIIEPYEPASNDSSKH